MKASDLKAIPGIVLDQDEPVFSEPWEAEAFARVVGLHQNGMFSWEEWAEVLGNTISLDDGTTPYYQLWLVALEDIIGKKSLVDGVEIEQRKADWKAALLATPHGQPIELGKG